MVNWKKGLLVTVKYREKIGGLQGGIFLCVGYKLFRKNFENSFGIFFN